jgi:CcmD family protein
MPTLISLLLAQVSPEDITLELQRLQRNYQFLSYGLVAAWLILVIYVLMMTRRQRRLKREIAHLRAMLEEKKR